MAEIKPKHTNPSKYLHEQMKAKGLRAYTQIHIYSLIKQFIDGKVTQRSMDTYNEWLEMKKIYSNWD